MYLFRIVLIGGLNLIVLASEGNVLSDFCRDILIPPELCAADQQKCKQNSYENGCSAGDYCFPQRDSQGCALFCPPLCSREEMFCKGTLQSDGCTSKHVCKPRFDPVTGCPNHCDLKCSSSERMCPGVRQECCGRRKVCCNPQPTCVPENIDCPPQDMNSDGCPYQEPDPTGCEYGQLLCDGGLDINGCPRPKYCHQPIADTPSLVRCPQFCPESCNYLFEMACPPTYDINGCQEPIVCRRFASQCPESRHIKDYGCPAFKEIGVVCHAGDEQACAPDPLYLHQIASDGEEVFQGETICYLMDTCEKATVPGSRGQCPAHCPTQCVQVIIIGLALSDQKIK